MFDLHLPTLSVVLGSAAIDSINPCAIGVLILMISVVLGGKGSTAKLLKLGGLYIFAIFLTYLVAGLGLVYFFTKVPLWVAEYLSVIVGAIVIFAGVLEKTSTGMGKGFPCKFHLILQIKFTNFQKICQLPGLYYLEVLLQESSCHVLGHRILQLLPFFLLILMQRHSCF